MPSAPTALADVTPAAAPRRPMGGRFRGARVLGALLLLAPSVLGLAWLILQWGILPRIDTWRPELAAQASRLLGRPVTLGRLSATGGGAWAQRLQIDGLELRDAEGRSALRLDRLSVVLTPASLLHWPPRIRELRLDGPSLDLRRDAAGRFWVGGLVVDPAAPAAGEAAARPGLDWLLRLPRLRIVGGRLHWQDALRGAPPLALDAVDLQLDHGLRQHALRLDATPPAGWGERLSLRARWQQPWLAGLDPLGGRLLAAPSDWRRWRGSLYAELPRADVQQLSRHLSLPIELQRGDGALRAWLDFADGRAGALVADLALDTVTLRLAPDLAPLDLRRLRGRLRAQDGPDGGQLALEDLAFDTADGEHWPALRGRLDWRRGPLASVAAATPPAASAPIFGAPPVAASPAPAPPSARAAVTAAPVRPLNGGSLSLARLDLAPLHRLAARLPLPPGLRSQLDALAPAGRLQDLNLRWDGPPEAPRSVRLDSAFTDLQLAAAPLPADPLGRALLSEGSWLGRPGVRGLNGQLSLTESGGQASLNLRDGAVGLPGVFAEPVLPLRSLDARLDWQREPGGWRVDLAEAVLATADWQGRFNGRWRLDDGEPAPGRLELDGRIDRVALDRVAPYLPLALLPELRIYLRDALQGGQGENLRLRLAGRLRDFPFVDADGRPRGGEFRVSAALRGARFDYVPWDVWMGPEEGQGPRRRWPALAGIDGELRVEGRSLSIAAVRARLADPALGRLQLSDIEARIPDLGQDATLQLQARARGPAAEMLRFVELSPVGHWLGGALTESSASGDIGLELQPLRVPLLDAERSTVRGQVQWAGASLRLGPDLPPLSALRGSLAFTEQGFSLQGAGARALGGELTAEGGLPPGGRTRLVLQGTATAEGLRRAPELGPWSRLAQRLEGQAPWRATLAWTEAGLDWEIASPLSGLAAQLPAPLDKRAEASLPLRIRSRPLERAAGQPPQHWLGVDLGPVGAPPRLQVRLLGEQPAEGPVRWRRSALGLGATAPEPRGQGAAELQLDRLDVEAWQAVGRLLSGESSVGVAGGLLPAETLPPLGSLAASAPLPPPGQAAPAAPAAPADSILPLPAQIELRAGELLWAGRRLSGLQLSLGRDGADWRARLQADQAAGTLLWQPGQGPGGRLQVRFSHLRLPQEEARAVSELLDRPAPAGQGLPAVDGVVESFELRGKALGRLEVQASQRAADSGWRLDRLSLATPEARLEAQGEWLPARGPGAVRRTELSLRLDSSDAGRLLARLGQGEVLRGGVARLEGRLGWQGSPLDFDHGSLDGQLRLAVGPGQFLQAEPGVARLLGVLSLQSLPRRLLLDFRDVFAQGWSFDAIDGDVSIVRGLARTQNLRTRGPQALVLTEGEADLARETQDLRVWVVPEINAGAASLAYAAINPAVGLGSFLAQWFLRRPLAEAGTRAFHVSGSWADPQVERLARTPPTPAAAQGASDPSVGPAPAAPPAAVLPGSPATP